MESARRTANASETRRDAAKKGCRKGTSWLTLRPSRPTLLLAPPADKRVGRGVASPGLTQTPYSYSRRPNTEVDVVKDRVES